MRHSAEIRPLYYGPRTSWLATNEDSDEDDVDDDEQRNSEDLLEGVECSDTITTASTVETVETVDLELSLEKPPPGASIRRSFVHAL